MTGGNGMAGPAAERKPAVLLVVDDNEMNRDLLCRRLASRGYVTRGAESGAQALALLEREPVDLVLLDVMMPEMSGLEVLRRIREDAPAAELPVIMATALDESRDVVEALGLGANDYVTKPLDMAVVAARVETHLALRRANEEVRRLNRHLARAQERITELVGSGAEAFRDFAGWSRSTAAGVAGTLGVAEVAVFLLQGDGLHPVGEPALQAPSLADLDAAAGAPSGVLTWGSEAVAPVLGPRGDVLGAVAARGRLGPWDDVDLRLLRSFAQQAGGALEMHRMREELAAEARRRAAAAAAGAAAREVLRICPSCWSCFGAETESCPEDGWKLREDHELSRRLLDRYQLRRVLGEGGMGTVFEARDERLGRDVAIKIIKPEHFHNAPMRRRFEREARTIAEIAHPGVVSLFDSGDLGDGSLYIVMELLRGWDLADVYRLCGPGTPWQVGQLLRQGAAALAAAHRRGIVHRDVKPDNVFLVPDAGRFQVKLVDFGLARRIAQDTRLTQSGLIVGTPAYMAPEQVAGREVDQRTDVYCFAAVAYQALVGRGVTTETEIDRVFVDVVRNPPPLVSELLPRVPEEVDEAFRAALAKAPDERPGDVEAWVGSFVHLVEQLPARSKGWVFPPPGAAERGVAPPATTVVRAGPDATGP